MDEITNQEGGEVEEEYRNCSREFDDLSVHRGGVGDEICSEQPNTATT